MSHWTQNYIGLPYSLGGRSRSGLDCWGLVHLFFFEQKGIVLPLLPGLPEAGAKSIVEKINQEAATCAWRDVTWEAKEEGDVVAMGRRVAVHHVGLWTNADGGKIVHCMGKPVTAETEKILRTKGFGTFSYYRYGLHH